MSRPSSAATGPEAAEEIRETRLDNGVRVLSETMPGVRSTAVGVWVRHGSAHEPPEVAGASHLLEHLVFKGTETRSARQIATALEELGGSLDAYTGRERTAYRARVLDTHVPRALDVVADLIRRPTLRDDDLELERKVVLEEISTVEDTPDDLVFELHGERLWDGHPYGRSILGSRESLGRLTRDHLRRIHRESYRSGDLVVAAAGRIEHGAFAERARPLFGDLPASPEPPTVPRPESRRGGEARIRRETTQTHVVLGTSIPGHSDDRRYALVLLSAALGGGMSSRLFQSIREEKGLAYTVYSFQSFFSKAGVTGVYVGTRPGSADRVVDAIREEYDRLAREGLPADELERIKGQVKGEAMLALESTGSRLHRLADFALHDEPLRSLDQVLERVDAVDVDQARRVAREFFDPEHPFVLRLGPDDHQGEPGGALRGPRPATPTSSRPRGRVRGPIPVHSDRSDGDPARRTVHPSNKEIKTPMIIGVPKEIKTNEYRVALVPAGAEAFHQEGHRVLVESGAGEGSGFADALYQHAHAEIVDSAEEVWERAEMIMKVKEPIEPEWPMIREDQVLFTYFHFAASVELTRAVLDSGAVAIAYETVQLDSGELPLLTPMSEVAGRMAVQEGAKYLERFYDGRGVLLGGVPGVLPAHVVILGGGVVGTNAAKMAAGMGADVTILDISLDRLRQLEDVLPANVNFLFSNRFNILEQIETADLLIGGVLLAGKKAPMLVRRDDLARMQDGSVIVDVAVDQGGCVETIEPTTHEDPIYQVEGVIHYGVANMPGAVPRTSTLALTNATLPYALDLAGKGWREACADDPALAEGVNVVDGVVTYEGVAEAFDMDFEPVAEHLSAPVRT